MNKKIAFLGICISFCFISMGQVNDSLKIYLTEYQRVVFITSDSVYYFTLFIESSGKFYFRNGFIDSTYKFAGTIAQVKKHHLTDRYARKFKYRSNIIDTIYNYYPVDMRENDELRLKNIADELKGSYLLKQLGEPELINSKQNVIRVLYPCEELNSCNHYHVFAIWFHEESARMYVISGHSIDNNGFQILHKDSSLLKKGDINRINKQLSKINAIEDMVCREPGNPWIMEYQKNADYKRFIISNYCLRGKKSISSIAKVCYAILAISKDYFNTNCSVNKIKN